MIFSLPMENQRFINYGSWFEASQNFLEESELWICWKCSEKVKHTNGGSMVTYHGRSRKTSPKKQIQVNKHTQTKFRTKPPPSNILLENFQVGFSNTKNRPQALPSVSLCERLRQFWDPFCFLVPQAENLPWGLLLEKKRSAQACARLLSWAWLGHGVGVAWAGVGRGMGVAWAWRGRGVGGRGVWAWLDWTTHLPMSVGKRERRFSHSYRLNCLGSMLL